jgi:hypothetical protein
LLLLRQITGERGIGGGRAGKIEQNPTERASEAAAGHDDVGTGGASLCEAFDLDMGAKGEDADSGSACSVWSCGFVGAGVADELDCGVGGVEIDEHGDDAGIGETSGQHVGGANRACGNTNGGGLGLDSRAPQEIGGEIDYDGIDRRSHRDSKSDGHREADVARCVIVATFRGLVEAESFNRDDHFFTTGFTDEHQP